MDGLLELNGIDGSADRAAVARLALRIVSQMVGTNQVETGGPRRDLVQMLSRAARTGDPALFGQLQAEFRNHRITGERVIDIYIPAAVSQIGAAWHDDEITVLQATVAFARLQDLLRELGIACTADHVGRPDGPRVLLVLPQREQHTISALLAASRMRRMGISVSIEFLAGPAEVVARMRAQPFDAVFLSVANLSVVATCRQIIQAISRVGKSDVPVVLGGPILALDPGAADTVGADIVTTNVEHALRACGLLVASDAVL